VSFLFNEKIGDAANGRLVSCACLQFAVRPMVDY